MHPYDKRTREIIGIIRSLMKSQSKSYQDLASHLHLSLASIKKIMTGSEIPLTRLLSICEFLGLELQELIQLTESADAGLYFFTEEQEKYFARNPSCLAFLFELYNAKLSPVQIQKKHKLSLRSVNHYLKKLQQMDLIAVNSKNQVRVKVKGVISWSDHGVLGSTFSRQMALEFAKWAGAKITEPGVMFLQLYGWSLTPSNYEDYKREYMDLANKYRQISSYNRKILKESQYDNYSIMELADIWDEKMFSDVRDLYPDE